MKTQIAQLVALGYPAAAAGVALATAGGDVQRAALIRWAGADASVEPAASLSHAGQSCPAAVPVGPRGQILVETVKQRGRAWMVSCSGASAVPQSRSVVAAATVPQAQPPQELQVSTYAIPSSPTRMSPKDGSELLVVVVVVVVPRRRRGHGPRMALQARKAPVDSNGLCRSTSLRSNSSSRRRSSRSSSRRSCTLPPHQPQHLPSAEPVGQSLRSSIGCLSTVLAVSTWHLLPSEALLLTARVGLTMGLMQLGRCRQQAVTTSVVGILPGQTASCSPGLR